MIPNTRAVRGRGFSLKEGEQRREIVLKLKQACRISGRVVDEKGNVPEDASRLVVHVWFKADHRERYESKGMGVNVSDGSYVIDGLSEKPAYVTVENQRAAKEGDGPPPVYYPGTFSRSEAKLVTFENGRSVENVNITRRKERAGWRSSARCETRRQAGAGSLCRRPPWRYVWRPHERPIPIRRGTIGSRAWGKVNSRFTSTPSIADSCEPVCLSILTRQPRRPSSTSNCSGERPFPASSSTRTAAIGRALAVCVVAPSSALATGADFSRMPTSATIPGRGVAMAGPEAGYTLEKATTPTVS